MFNIKFNSKSYHTKTIKAILGLFGHSLIQSFRNSEGERFYQVCKGFFKIEKDVFLEPFQEIYKSIEKRYLGLIKKDLPNEIEDLNYSGKQIARDYIGKGLNAMPEVANNIINSVGSGISSIAHCVKDSYLFLEKAIKNLEKRKNEAIQKSEEMLLSIVNDLGFEFLASISDLEFILLAKGWTNNGLNDADFKKLTD